MNDVPGTAYARRQLDAIVAAARTLQSSVERLADAATDGSVDHPPRALEAVALATGLSLTEGQRRVCERVINVFETGSIQGRYGAISIFRDGPNRIRQITYGRSQTTEYGNLRELVQMYVNANGTFSASLRPYVDRIGVTPLTDDNTFKDLLRRAGNEDPVMRSTQDAFFDRRYFQPAMRWAHDNGFTRPLSALIIYDSFIHSGGILDFLRQRFPEVPPARGGDEKIWITQYIDVRHLWLTNHTNPDVRPSNYRTRDLRREIAAGNWDLAILPIMANGVPVDDAPVSMMEAAPASMTMALSGAASDSETDWCEAEPPAGLAAFAAFAAADSVVAASRAELAARILAHPNIVLATEHVSGVVDQANARQNIVDTAAGQPARRSSYGNAPGGAVMLDTRMLSGLLTLADTYSFHVSELCGGNHSPTSRHYAGITADINVINGRHVSASHPDQMPFRTRCQALGATEVLGPGVANHATHIHAAWPRP